MSDDEDPNQNLHTQTTEQVEVDKGVEENNFLDTDARNFITIKWLAARCGKTPTEEFIMALRAYRTGLRKKMEPIAEYVTRFQNLTCLFLSIF